MLVMVCCIVGPNGAAKQQDFSYKLMIRGRQQIVPSFVRLVPCNEDGEDDDDSGGDDDKVEDDGELVF